MLPTASGPPQRRLLSHKPSHESGNGHESADRLRIAPLTTFELVLCGTVAGMGARLITAPLDRVRLLYTVPGRPYTVQKGVKTLRTIYRHHGVSGLFRGNMASMFRVVPYASTVFVTYDTVLNSYVRNGPAGSRRTDISARFLAGAVAGVTATALTYPMEVVRVHMAGHWGPEPRYVFSTAAYEIVKLRGFRALYSGLGIAVVSIAPLAGVSFVLYEEIKALLEVQWLHGINDGEPEPVADAVPHLVVESHPLSPSVASDRSLAPKWLKLMAGMFAAFVPLVCVYPLHLMRRRFILKVAEGAAKPSVLGFSEFASLYRKTVAHEGPKGLFKLFSLATLKVPILTAASFSFNDYFRSAVWAWHRDIAEAAAVDGKSTVDGRTLTAVERLLAGAVAGVVAKTSIAPADRVKVLFQVHPELRFSFREAWRTGVRVASTGITQLWRGNSAMVVRVAPYAAVSYASFDRYMQIWSSFLPDSSPVLHRFLAGASSGCTATLCTYPLDLLRAKFAATVEGSTHAHNVPRYSTYSGAIAAIYKEQSFRGFTAGLGPTVVGILPYAGLSFMTYETLKAAAFSHYQVKSAKDLSTPILLAMGGLAGLMAQTATYPLDVVRRRMQVHSGHENYRTAIRAFKTIYRTEGIRGGLYKPGSCNFHPSGRRYELD